jgi:hypothetical protein
LFRPIPKSLPADYEAYRQAYAIANGLEVPHRESHELSLRRPVGTGWLAPSCSEQGLWFRWCHIPNPVVDIPIARPGRYEVRAYVHPNHVKAVRAELVGGSRTSRMETQAHGHISVIHGQAKLARAGWLQIRFQGIEAATEAQVNGHMKDLYFVLGKVLLRQVA